MQTNGTTSCEYLWELQMARCTDPDVFAFLDESVVDDLTDPWANGWSPSNTQPSKAVHSFKESASLSFPH